MSSFVTVSVDSAGRLLLPKEIREKAGLNPDHLPPKERMDLTGSQNQIKAWKDVWSAGQGVGSIHAVEPLSAIVARLREEYESAI